MLAVAAIGLGLFGALRCIAGELSLGFSALALSVVVLRMTPGLWPIDAAPYRKQADRLVFAGVLLAIAFFRFHRLVPPGLWGDDALNGLLAFDVIDGVIASPFELVSHAHSWFHALTNYAIAASFLLFGADLASLRIPGVIAGCASGVLVYAIAGRLFDRPTAAFAGLLFASSPMQIAHSKSLTQVVFGLMFLCAGVYAVLRGTEQKSTGWLATGAVGLAASLYTYHAAKLAPLVVLPLLVGPLLRGERTLRSLVPMVAVFALCLLPAVASFWNRPEALLARAQAVSIVDEVRQAGSLEPLLLSAVKTLGIFHVEQGPPQYHWFGPGKDPALTPIAAALVLSGVFASVVGWREARHQLLLWWFAVGLAPAVLSTEAPRAYRALLATPAVFIWAALPLHRTLARQDRPNANARPCHRTDRRGAGVRLQLLLLPLVHAPTEPLDAR